MSESRKPVVNIDEVPLFDLRNGDAFAAKIGRVENSLDYWDGEF